MKPTLSIIVVFCGAFLSSALQAQQRQMEIARLPVLRAGVTQPYAERLHNFLTEASRFASCLGTKGDRSAYLMSAAIEADKRFASKDRLQQVRDELSGKVGAACLDAALRETLAALKEHGVPGEQVGSIEAAFDRWNQQEQANTAAALVARDTVLSKFSLQPWRSVDMVLATENWLKALRAEAQAKAMALELLEGALHDEQPEKFLVRAMRIGAQMEETLWPQSLESGDFSPETAAQLRREVETVRDTVRGGRVALSVLSARPAWSWSQPLRALRTSYEDAFQAEERYIDAIDAAIQRGFARPGDFARRLQTRCDAAAERERAGILLVGVTLWWPIGRE